MEALHRNFRYLNREGRWLDFQSSGLEIGEDGAFRLQASPRLAAGDPLLPLSNVTLQAPAGVAVDARGRVFYSDPSAPALWAQDTCDSAWSRVECVTEREGLGALGTPRGLLVLERSRRLLVVDSDGARLLFLDLETLGLREVWGNHGFYPQQTGLTLREPWSVAADAAENLYVLEHGAGSVSKFARTGDRDHDFEAHVAASGLVAPGAVAVAEREDGVLVFVSDLVHNEIRVFRADGSPLVDTQGASVILRFDGMGNVLALAACGDTLYVADSTGQRLLTFRIGSGFPFAGDAVGFAQAASALACDGAGGLLLLRATGDVPLALETKGAFVRSGLLWSGPVSGGPLAVTWERLRATVTGAPPAHIELYFAVSNRPQAPPVAVDSDAPFADPGWRALPQDATDALFRTDPTLASDANTGLYLFVGARFSGDRSATLSLSQLRADFDGDGYERYLPKIYREPAADGDFVRRYLALFRSLLGEIEDETEGLLRYLEPAAAPAQALPWLATWLAADIDQADPTPRVRRAIANAYERQRWRGTAEGLRLALLDEAGVHATISEPLRASALWGFPAEPACGDAGVGPPALGLGSYLPAAEPGGAVLGAAVLDRSYLITDAQFGEPPFEELAHQFIVEIARAEASTPELLARVRAIIEREKPAHTLYRLELIEPGLRVGHQARIGVDTLLRGAPMPSALGETKEASGIRLGGSEPMRVGRLRLGAEIRL